MQKRNMIVGAGFCLLVVCFWFPVAFLIVSLIVLALGGLYLFHSPARRFVDGYAQIQIQKIWVIGTIAYVTLVSLTCVGVIRNRWIEEARIAKDRTEVREATAKVSKALEQASRKMEHQDLEGARKLLEAAEANLRAENLDQARKLLLDCNKADSDEYIRTVLADMPEEAFRQFITAPRTFSETYFSNSALNEAFLRRLAEQASTARQLRDEELRSREEARRANEQRQREAAEAAKLAQEARTRAEAQRIENMTYSASELVAAYDENEVKADGRLKGRKLIVKGRASQIGKDILSSMYIALSAGDETYRQVQCYFSSKHTNALEEVSAGDLLYIEGTCDGLMGNVLINDCHIVRHEK